MTSEAAALVGLLIATVGMAFFLMGIFALPSKTTREQLARNRFTRRPFAKGFTLLLVGGALSFATIPAPSRDGKSKALESRSVDAASAVPVTAHGLCKVALDARA